MGSNLQIFFPSISGMRNRLEVDGSARTALLNVECRSTNEPNSSMITYDPRCAGNCILRSRPSAVVTGFHCQNWMLQWKQTSVINHLVSLMSQTTAPLSLRKWVLKKSNAIEQGLASKCKQ
jgi:hypothetical protein